MARVTKCCGCCSLKVGIHTYGVLNLISRTYSLLRLFSVNRNYKLNSSYSTYEKVDGFEGFILSDGFIYTMAAYIITTSVILIVALIGVCLEKRNFLIPHLVAMVIQILLEIIIGIWGAFNYSFVFVIFLALDVCLQIYIFICIRSFFEELAEKEDFYTSHNAMGEAIQ